MTTTSQHQEALGLTITRTFAAPIELVWRAWTDAELLMRWYCPKGFTVLSAEMDARVGGKWSATMQSPEEETFHHSGEILEVEAYRRLVATHIWDAMTDDPSPTRVIRVELESVPEGTRMVFEHAPFATEELRDSHVEGWGEALDKLASELPKMS